MLKEKNSNNCALLLLAGVLLATLSWKSQAYPVILKGTVCGKGNCEVNKSH